MDQLPEVPTLMAFVAPMPSPAPPPPPPAAPAQAVLTRQVRATAPNAAPIEAPSRIEPETGIERVEAGVGGGVEGGIPGGIVGGIVGGISEALPPPPPSPLPASRRPVRVSGEISPPTLLIRVAPIYPSLAQQAQIQGLVIIEATVDETGRVRETKVLRSVKFLDEAAITAVRQWQYSPLLLNGEAMPFVLTVTVSFRVDATSVER